MANLDRLKVVLVENQETGKWLAEQLGKSNCIVRKKSEVSVFHITSHCVMTETEMKAKG